MRSYLIENSKIIEIVDYKENKIFQDPTVYICIFSFLKIKQGLFPYEIKLKVYDIDVDDFILKKINVDSVNENSFKEENYVLNNISSKNSVFPLERFFQIKDVGINYWTKGSGKSRIGNSIGKRVLYSGSKMESKDIPFLKGKDVQKYYVQSPSNYLKHNFKDFLNPLNDLFRYSEEIINISPKIIYRQTANKIIACIDENKHLVDKTLHIIFPNSIGKEITLKYLLANLNSTLFIYLYRFISQETEGRAFSQIKTTYIKKIPIKYLSKTDQLPFIHLVDKIISLKKLGQDTTSLENEIDVMVYKLYELTYDEVKIVDPEFCLSATDYAGLT